MKIDLSTILKMVEEEDKKLEENKLTPIKKKQESALDLQGLFSLFEELEPTLGVVREEEDLEGFKNLEMVLKIPRAHITSKMGNRTTEDYKYFGQLVKGLTGGKPTPVEVFEKIQELQEKLLKQTDKTLSISQNVSAMVLMEAIYSFFNSFYSIGGGGEKGATKAGTRLGFFAESLAVALYGAVGTIPHGFANSTLYSLADLMDPVDNVPISLKTTSQLIKAGSKFYLLHDLVKYKKVYFDILEKSDSGASNIYDVTYKRHELTLEEYKPADENEKQCIEELKSIYKQFDKNEKNSQNIPTNENENIITEDQGFSFKPEPRPSGQGELARANKFHDYVYLLSLYYSGQINNLRDSWQNIESYYKPTTSKQASFKQLSEEGPIDGDLGAFAVRQRRANLLGRNITTNPIASLRNLLDFISDNGKLLSSEELEKRILENPLLGFVSGISEQRKQIYGYVLTYNKNALLNRIENPGIRNELEQNIEALGGVGYPEIPKFSKREQQPAREPPPEESEDDKRQRMLDIFRKQYGDQGGKLDITILNEVGRVYRNHAGLNKIDARREVETGKLIANVSINLNPESLKRIFQNGNNSLEENYRNLVAKLNQVSELMNKYFLSPETNPADGNELKNSAKEIPEIAEKAVKNTPATQTTSASTEQEE